MNEQGQSYPWPDTSHPKRRLGTHEAIPPDLLFKMIMTCPSCSSGVLLNNSLQTFTNTTQSTRKKLNLLNYEELGVKLVF